MRCQGFQLRLVKVMHITQAAPAAAPVEQVITSVHVLVSETHLLPGLHADFEFIAVQELPLRMDELAAWAQQVVDFFQNA